MKYLPLLILFALTGCQIFDSSDTERIDPDLVADWYMINSVSSGGPSPLDVYVRGWSINAEGELRTLGVVDSTGALGIFDPGYKVNIVRAGDGFMMVEYTGHPDVAEAEMEYQVTSDELVIEQGVGLLSGTFQRSQIGNEVVPPAPSSLTVKIDDANARNVNIAYQIPTAYVIQTPASGLHLTSALGGRRVMIHIDQYDGPGTYTIGKNQGEYFIIGSDWVQPFVTLSESAGTIFIDCDTDTSRCSGAFEFSTKDPANSGDESPVLEDGVFDVPFLE